MGIDSYRYYHYDSVPVCNEAVNSKESIKKNGAERNLRPFYEVRT